MNKTIKLIALLVLFMWQVVYAQQGTGAWKKIEYPDNFCDRYKAELHWAGDEVICWGGILQLDDTSNSPWKKAKSEGKHIIDYTYNPSNNGEVELLLGKGFVFTEGWKINPKTAAFKKMPSSGLPAMLYGYNSAFSGRYLFLASNGTTAQNFYGLYDNETNTWKKISMLNAPSGRLAFALAWTGEEFFIWGGSNLARNKIYNEGFLYNPTTNIWRKTAVNPFGGRTIVDENNASVFLHNDEVFMLAGMAMEELKSDGVAYNTKTNQWRKISENPYNGGWFAQVDKIWTGTEMLHLTHQNEPTYQMERNRHKQSFAYNPTTDTYRSIESERNGKIWNYKEQMLATPPDGWVLDALLQNGNDADGYNWMYKTYTTKICTEKGFFMMPFKDIYFYDFDAIYTEPKIEIAKGTFTDSRNNHTYNTFTINGQTWLAEALVYATPHAKCFDNAENCEDLGFLYNIKEAKGACPTGWGLPTKEDFEKLIESFGGGTFALSKIFDDDENTLPNWRLGGTNDRGNEFFEKGSFVRVWINRAAFTLSRNFITQHEGEVDTNCYIFCIKK